VIDLWGDQVLVYYADHVSAYPEMLNGMMIFLFLSLDLIAGYEDCAYSTLLQC
jgi:hypothetical protein